jgi:serine/threonine-protein kinase
MARLRSPDIVQVFDAGIVDEQPFLVMELLEGETLRNQLERGAAWSLTATAAVARQMARALAVIHREGMVHRDVTPGNIFIVSPTPEFSSVRCKLLDFGIAKQLTNEPRITTSGALVGSPAYMSPEQARSEVVGGTSDLWSLGAVLYRSVTGEDAFRGKSITEVLFAICAGEVPRATSVNAELPEELDAFFEKAFARNPSFRFESAEEMGAAFTEIAERYSDNLEANVAGGASGPHTVSPSGIRSTTAMLLVARNSFGLRVRQALKSRAAIAAMSLVMGAMGSTLLRQRPAANDARSPVKPVDVAVSEGPLGQASSERWDALPSTWRFEPADPSSGPAAVKTSAIRKRGASPTHQKPSVTRNPSSRSIDPIFGLPVEAK